MLGRGAADGSSQNVVEEGRPLAQGMLNLGTRPSNGDGARKANVTAEWQDGAADMQLKVSTAARASGLGWPGLVPGDTARAAQEGRHRARGGGEGAAGDAAAAAA